MARSSDTVLIRFRLPRAQIKQILAAQKVAGAKETVSDFFKDHLAETLERETVRKMLGELKSDLVELRSELVGNAGGMRNQTLTLAASFQQLADKVIQEDAFLRQQLGALIAALLQQSEGAGDLQGRAQAHAPRAPIPRKHDALEVLRRVGKKNTGV